MQLPRERAEAFYGEHAGKPFFGGLVDFMTSGPCVALVLARHDAIKGWRALMGPTNTLKAREEAPDRCDVTGGSKFCRLLVCKQIFSVREGPPAKISCRSF